MGQTTTVTLTGQQAEAVTKIHDWYHHSPEQVFRLFGFAGTGKTTLAQHIVDHLDLDGQALYAAYTGKAAYVLRTKGADGASTVHQLIYTPVEKVRAKLDELVKRLETEADPLERDAIQQAIRAEERKLERPMFVLKEESDLEHAPILILDEVSMIGSGIAHDLLGFGTKLLVLGDPAQLPPVDGGGYFINHPPNHLLTEIHRSALDSPVTRLATAVRNSVPGDRSFGIPDPDGHSGRRPGIARGDLASFDQVLVGTNRTRWAMINQIRALQGLAGPIPLPGDRIIVLANNYEANVFNGQLFTVAACKPVTESPDVLNMLVLDDDGQPRVMSVWACGFEGADGERLAKRNGRSKIIAATFGQAITCHKSQGSQWNRVLVIDESFVFGGMAYKEHVALLGPGGAGIESHMAAQRWLYTAITRAAEQVVIVSKGR